MRVLFINPAMRSYVRSPTLPLGLVSIATWLNANGHTAKIVDRSIKRYNISRVIKEFSPDIVGVSVISNKGIDDAVKVSAEVKRHGLKVVWGGTLPSSVPKTVLRSGCVDIVSVGEGEATWLDLLNALSNGSPLESVDGLQFLRDGEIVATKERSFIDLTTLPPSDWSLVDVPEYFQTYYDRKKVLFLYSSKGCPGSCTFCFNHSFHRSTRRRRSLQAVIEEIRRLVDGYGMDGVYFADELWAVNKDEMYDICSLLKDSGLNIHWGLQSRVGVFDAEDFRKMYEAGCRWIFFGVESGCPEMLKKLKKGIRLQRVDTDFIACGDAGIVSVAAFIIGLPGETRAQIRETVQFALGLHATQWQFSLFMPFPGSEIYNSLVAKKLIVPPSSLRGLGRIRPTEQVFHNFSEATDLELKIIRSFFMWKCFVMKKLSKDIKKYGFAKKMIKDAVKNLWHRGTLHFFASFFNAAHMFLSSFFYAHFFPSVKRKYGLK